MLPILTPLPRREPPQSAKERAAEADRFYREAPTGLLPEWLRAVFTQWRKAPPAGDKRNETPDQASLKTRVGCNSPAL